MNGWETLMRVGKVNHLSNLSKTLKIEEMTDGSSLF